MSLTALRNLPVQATPTWVLLCCLGLAGTFGLASISLSVLAAAGFPLDDSWIHQVVGRNLALHGAPSFFPGEAPAGSTSAIWPFVIAAGYRWLPTVPPFILLLVLNVILTGLTLLAIAVMALRDRLPRPDTACFLLLPALTGNFLWLAATGMEHSLFITLVIGAALAWTLPGPAGAARPLVAGLALGLAILTRIEAVVFVPAFVLAGIAFRDGRFDMRRYAREVALLALPVAVGGILLVLNNYWTSGSPLPVTMQGRRWLYFGENSKPLLTGMLDLRYNWAVRIQRWYLGFDAGTSAKPAAGAVRMAAMLLMLAGLASLAQQRAKHVLFLLALCVLDVGVYGVMLPATGHGGRYQALLMPFILPLIGTGLVAVFRLGLRLGLRRAQGDGRGALIQALPVCIMIGFGVLSVLQWARITQAGIQQINVTHVTTGRWIADNLPAGAKVASFDIGAIGYYSGRRIVDLGGLTDPGFVRYLYTRRVDEYLKEHDIRWLILPFDSQLAANAPSGFLERLGLQDSKIVSRRRVVEISNDLAVWAVAHDATTHSDPAQVVYELGWRDAEGRTSTSAR